MEETINKKNNPIIETSKVLYSNKKEKAQRHQEKFLEEGIYTLRFKRAVGIRQTILKR